MEKVLVAGAAGFTGRAIVEVLSPHCQLRLFDTRSIPDAPDAVQGDLADYEAVHQAMRGVDKVVNAMMAPGEAYETPEICFQSNVLGTANLLEAAREEGVRRFVHLSTTAIFSGAENAYLDIDTAPLPRSMYGLTKHLQEVLCQDYARAYGMASACLRIAGGIVCGRTGYSKEGKPLQKGTFSEGWVCRYDIAEVARLALLVDGLEFEFLYIGSAPELMERVNIQHTMDRLGWRPACDFQEYR